MDSDEFRLHGKAMIDYIAQYLDNVRDRPVLPSVEPGYLRHMIPDEVPQEPERWDAIMADIERVVMPGVSWFYIFLFLNFGFQVNALAITTFPCVLSGW